MPHDTITSPKVCGVPECTKPILALGLCGGHYQRWKNNGAPETFCGFKPCRVERKRKLCGIPGCFNLSARVQMCMKHYMRWGSDGKPDQIEGFRPTIRTAAPPADCIFPECDKEQWLRGLCQFHYNRWIKRGKPSPIQENLPKLADLPKPKRVLLPKRNTGRPMGAWHDGLTEAVCIDCGQLTSIKLFSISTAYLNGQPRIYRKRYCNACRKKRNATDKKRRRPLRYGLPSDPTCTNCGCDLPNCLSKRCKPCAKKANNKRAVRSRFSSAMRTRGWKRLAIEKKGGCCSRCGFRSEITSVFEFHHRDPSLKSEIISSIHTWDAYWLELQKCDLLCSNCHRITHAELHASKRRPKSKPTPLFPDSH